MILDVKRRRLIISDFLEYKLTKKQVRLLLILCDNEFHNYEDIMRWCFIDNVNSLTILIRRLKNKINNLSITLFSGKGCILKDILKITY